LEDLFMGMPLRATVPVLPGRKIEFASPDLPEQGDVEVLICLPAPHIIDEGAEQVGCESRYPAAVELEYTDLISRREIRPYTADEEMRLGQLKDAMNSLDALQPSTTRPAIALSHIADHLSALRHELAKLVEST
jgi:hypothetical protein